MSNLPRTISCENPQNSSTDPRTVGEYPRRAVSAVAYGKINLHLAVGDARADGYHELRTVFQSVDLAETVTLSPEVGTGHRLSVTGRDAHVVPTDESNLAWRAVDAVCSVSGRASGAVHIHIDKQVPVAGGMAGGSADCAAALLAANEYFGAGLSREQLIKIGAGLGADIPFCLMGGTALGLGRGDELSPVLTRGEYHWAIACDKRGLSTPEVFRKLDEQREKIAQDPTRPNIRAGEPTAMIRALVSGQASEIAGLLANDLQAPALSLMPSLRATFAAAEEAGALAGIVSGSGPTVAVLCDSADHAVHVASAISAAGRATSTATTVSPARGLPRLLGEHDRA